MILKLIPEILQEISVAPTEEMKLRLLQESKCHTLGHIFKLVFSGKPLYRRDLPPHKPDPAPEGLAINSFYMESKRLYIFEAANPTDSKRKDQILIQMLETFHPSEIVVFENLFRGTFEKRYNIPAHLVNIVYPGVVTNEYLEQQKSVAKSEPKKSKQPKQKVATVEQNDPKPENGST